MTSLMYTCTSEIPKTDTCGTINDAGKRDIHSIQGIAICLRRRLFTLISDNESLNTNYQANKLFIIASTCIKLLYYIY